MPTAEQMLERSDFLASAPSEAPAAPVHSADTAAPLLARTVQIGPFGPGNYLLHVWLQLSCVVKGAEPFYAMLTDSLPVRFLAVEG